MKRVKAEKKTTVNGNNQFLMQEGGIMRKRSVKNPVFYL